MAAVLVLVVGIGVTAAAFSRPPKTPTTPRPFHPTVLAPQPGPATSGGAAGIGVMALGCSLRNFSPTHLNSFAYVIVSNCDAARAARLPGRTLHYFSPTSLTDTFSDGEVTYDRARASGWLLTDSNGQFVHLYNDPHDWLADVGSSAYQQATIRAIEATLAKTPGIDGLELDNILPDVQYFNPSRTWPAKYPSAQAWQDAQIAFVAVVGKALRAAGFYVMANPTGYNSDAGGGYDSGEFDQAWYQRVAQTGGVDALYAEGWLQNPTNPGQLMDDTKPGGFLTSWSGWQALVQVCQQNGVDFVGGMASGGRQAMRFGRGSFLLDWDGRGGMFFYTANHTYNGPDSFDPAWTTPVGTPLHAKTQLGPTVWSRAYTGGVVVVNAGADPWTGSINGITVTVPARDAAIR